LRLALNLLLAPWRGQIRDKEVEIDSASSDEDMICNEFAGERLLPDVTGLTSLQASLFQTISIHCRLSCRKECKPSSSRRPSPQRTAIDHAEGPINASGQLCDTKAPHIAVGKRSGFHGFVWRAYLIMLDDWREGTGPFGLEGCSRRMISASAVLEGEYKLLLSWKFYAQSIV
jgi:hypothetical protein